MHYYTNPHVLFFGRIRCNCPKNGVWEKMVVTTSGALLSKVDKIGGDAYSNSAVDVERASYRHGNIMVEFEIIMGGIYCMYIERFSLDVDFHVCGI